MRVTLPPEHKAYRQLGKDDLAKIDELEALGLRFSVVPDLD